MAFKMAMAWHVTGDDRYANKVLQIADAHAGNNKEWGVRWENGPLVSSSRLHSLLLVGLRMVGSRSRAVLPGH